MDLVGLDALREQLLRASNAYEKIEILDPLPEISAFVSKFPLFRSFFANLTPDCESAFKQLIAIGQGEWMLQNTKTEEITGELLRKLLVQLLSIDHFYRELGGIVGYQVKILQLMRDSHQNTQSDQLAYHSPSFVDIAEETDAVKEATVWGIEALPQMGELYPLGGAADRLHLVDETTGTELPAAKLPFAGRSLLHHLIRDLQAREHLYYKIHGVQLATPIGIMTSHEKENHRHVEQICEQFHWFGRPKDSFRFFIQPLVPTVNEQGNWCFSGPLKPLLKPGGHGVIWKLAKDEGVFSWFVSQNRKKMLVRQINNPLAGLDYGLLAFTGLGCQQEMIFGFASCPRLLLAAEGVNVLVERKKPEGRELVLTNIEYCDFTKFGIEDLPLKENEPFSRFSSNTNILFADLQAVSTAVDTFPFPGLLMNLKAMTYTTSSGEKREERAARLESTMQNIADVFVEEKPLEAPLKTERTFVTYNHRHKTISTAKKAFVEGKALQETPENCFYDLLLAHRELLQTYCQYTLPPLSSLEEYLQNGPDFLFLYHPALGPLYSSIRKKMQGGKLAKGAELTLEIAAISLQNLEVRGSLQIEAEQIMGHLDSDGILHYSDRVGECHLKNVVVDNLGVDWGRSQPFWKMGLTRFETVRIELKGRSIFRAENVHFLGAHTFVVEDGMEMRVRQKGGELLIESAPLERF